MSGVSRLEIKSYPTLIQIHKPYQSQLRMISLLREAKKCLECLGLRGSPPRAQHKIQTIPESVEVDLTAEGRNNVVTQQGPQLELPS